MEPAEYAKMAALQDRHWWFEAKRRMARELLGQHADSIGSGRVLEVGCGTGAMVPALDPWGRVVGLDAYAPALSYLRGASGVTGDAQQLPFVDASFDLVGCFDLLYHKRVPRVQAALDEVVRVLRPGGLFVLTDSACPALYGRHDAAHHGARRFKRPELEGRCRDAGLAVLHATYFHTAVFPAVAAARLGARWLSPGATTPSGKSQLEPAAAWINWLMRAVYAVEAPIAARWSLPFGVSVAILARRPPR